MIELREDAPGGLLRTMVSTLRQIHAAIMFVHTSNLAVVHSTYIAPSLCCAVSLTIIQSGHLMNVQIHDRIQFILVIGVYCLVLCFAYAIYRFWNLCARKCFIQLYCPHLELKIAAIINIRIFHMIDIHKII